MKPMPTSAATNRFSSSLESSSIVKFGFSRRSWNSCSIASRVCPAFGTTNGNFATSAMAADFDLSQRMLRRHDQNQFIPMNENHRQPSVRHRKRDDAEVDGVVHNRFENLSVVGALDVYRHVRILLLEVGKYIRQDVQAGALIRPHNDFAAWHTLHLGDSHQHRLSGVESLLYIFLKGLARRRERHFAARSVEQLGSYFLFQPRESATKSPAESENASPQPARTKRAAPLREMFRAGQNP